MTRKASGVARWKASVLKAKPMCEVGSVLGALLPTMKVLALDESREKLLSIAIWEGCGRRANDVVMHNAATERVARNVSICGPCRKWMVEHPALAVSLCLEALS